MRFMWRRSGSNRSHRYDEVRSECVAQLVSALVDDTTGQPTWTKVSAVVDRHSRGDLGYAAEAFSLLWNTLNQVGGAAAPYKDLPPVRPFDTHHGVYSQP